MQISNLNVQHTSLPNAYQVEPGGFAGTAKIISPKTLAYLNFHLFKELRNLGTSKKRICSALGLNSEEYDYIARLE